ncbi:uncharacterized protein LOC114040509 isoform X4 [Vombatus ursinus]|uniref:uncharacterized protein LOC114040509 isoform X4 n=1 Tax=Vombatus ursinus TaxID=29139 RepID=UPI000FFD6D61|nr:uncharacterized protein LOC114040509 isoform X4 [Vombatus ursinus]
MKMGLVVLVRNLLLTLCLCLVLGFMYYAAWKLHLLRWEDPNSGALTFDSVGRTLGSGRRKKNNVAFDFLSLLPSGLAVDSGQSRTQKEMIDARAARGPAQSRSCCPAMRFWPGLTILGHPGAGLKEGQRPRS